MASDPRGSPVGIVFRRLDTDLDRREAVRLLAGCGFADLPRSWIWFGLCDLTVADPGLLGVVAVRPVDAVTVRCCALAVSEDHRGRGLGRRLVAEVADRLRAAGFEQVLAPPARDRTVGAVLALAGFRARPPGQAGEAGWSSLAL